MTNEERAYIDAATNIIAKSSDVEGDVDPDAEVYLAENGAWVSCWVWVNKDEVAHG